MKTLCLIILSVHMASQTLLVLVSSNIKLSCRQCRAFIDCVPDWSLILPEGRNRICGKGGDK